MTGGGGGESERSQKLDKSDRDCLTDKLDEMTTSTGDITIVDGDDVLVVVVVVAAANVFFVNLRLRIARKLLRNVIVAQGGERVTLWNEHERERR